MMINAIPACALCMVFFKRLLIMPSVILGAKLQFLTDTNKHFPKKYAFFWNFAHLLVPLQA
jgi:hypothetical protein